MRHLWAADVEDVVISVHDTLDQAKAAVVADMVSDGYEGAPAWTWEETEASRMSEPHGRCYQLIDSRGSEQPAFAYMVPYPESADA